MQESKSNPLTAPKIDLIEDLQICRVPCLTKEQICTYNAQNIKTREFQLLAFLPMNSLNYDISIMNIVTRTLDILTFAEWIFKGTSFSAPYHSG